MKQLFFIILCGALLISSSALGILYTKESQHNQQLQAELQEEQAEITALQNQLGQRHTEIQSLESEKTQTQEQIQIIGAENENLTLINEDLMKKNEQLLKETQWTLNSIDYYSERLQQSIDWLRENAALPTERPYSSARTVIEDKCYKTKYDDCLIDTGCFSYANEVILGITYKTDEQVTGELDQMQDLVSFIQNKGGDCEDYALFFKAEWNHIIDKCVEERKEAKITSWYRYKVNNARTAVDIANIPGTFKYPTVICGYFKEKSETYGHCVIALTNRSITNISTIEYLVGAHVIEPQDGSYLGTVGSAEEDVALVSDEEAENDEAIISEIITDNDHFNYNETSGEWWSNQMFLQLLTEQKEKLQAISTS